MLILTRRVGETLKIGEDIEVTVLGLRGGQVRIGINAPRDVAVHREEILDCSPTALLSDDGVEPESGRD